jgi:hypothetical protein
MDPIENTITEVVAEIDDIMTNEGDNKGLIADEIEEEEKRQDITREEEQEEQIELKPEFMRDLRFYFVAVLMYVAMPFCFFFNNVMKIIGSDFRLNDLKEVMRIKNKHEIYENIAQGIIDSHKGNLSILNTFYQNTDSFVYNISVDTLYSLEHRDFNMSDVIDKIESRDLSFVMVMSSSLKKKITKEPQETSPIEKIK